jgi:hypothetical protein
LYSDHHRHLPYQRSDRLRHRTIDAHPPLFMRKFFYLLLILLAVAACNTANDTARDKKQLVALLTGYYDAMSRKDVKKMASLTTPNFILFEDGKVLNNESVAADVARLPSFQASFSFDSLNVHVGKTNASAYYYRNTAFTIEDSVYPPVSFLESATFARVDGKWKIRFLHSTMRH